MFLKKNVAQDHNQNMLPEVPQKKHLLHEKKEAQLVIAPTDYAFCASQQPRDHD